MEPAIGLGAAGPRRPGRRRPRLRRGRRRERQGRRSGRPSSPTASSASRSCPTASTSQTKGDANAEPDPSLIPATAVIGRVELTVPYAGFGVALLSSMQGILFLVSLAGVLLAATWLLETLEEDQREALHRRTAGAGGMTAPGRCRRRHDTRHRCRSGRRLTMRRAALLLAAILVAVVAGAAPVTLARFTAAGRRRGVLRHRARSCRRRRSSAVAWQGRRHADLDPDDEHRRPGLRRPPVLDVGLGLHRRRPR